MLEDAPLVARLPVGYRDFPVPRFIGYQLNRAHALGYAHEDELRAVAAGARSGRAVGRACGALAARAEAEGRLRNATSYLRLAEFFAPPRSPERVDIYTRYRELFGGGFAACGVMRHHVPYGESSLPAYRLAARGPALGTVLLHGGFDSLIEEFVGIWQRIAEAGFDVIAFEGPGQGGARALGGLTFDHDWEKPVGAVMDHFEVDRAALVGLSMGGYWCLRAAAHEARVEQVVSWSPVYDWLHRLPRPMRPVTRAMLRRHAFMRRSIRLRARLVPTLRHVVDHVLYLVDSQDEAAVVEWFLGMNPEHLCSPAVTQDVLLFVGERDSFQPPRLARAQAAALTGARSVTTRVFTRAEHADRHCQMGNLELACSELVRWLQSRSGA